MSAARSWIVVFAAGVAAAVLLCASSGTAAVSTARVPAWVPDGTVDAQALRGDGSTLYVGGDFDTILPNHGTFGVDDTQSVLDSPAMPKVAGGAVYAIVSDGAGGWYLGGDFTSVGSETRRGLARVESNGTVDTAFAPEVEGTVRSLATDGSTLYVGGSFTRVAGETRQGFAALDGSDGTLRALTADTSGWVYAVALSPDDSVVYLGGDFEDILGCADLVALDTGTGELTSSWTCPQPNGAVYAITVGGDGSIYLGGNFENLTGSDGQVSAYYVGKIGPDGQPDADFVSDENTDGNVYALALVGNDLYVGGAFSAIGGCLGSCSYLAKLDAATGTADSGWNVGVGGEVDAVAASTAGVTFGGDFSQAGYDSGMSPLSRNYLAFADASSGSVSDWDPAPGQTVVALARSGTSLAVGTTSGDAAAHVTRHNAAAFDTATGRPTAWDPDADDTVEALAVAGSTVYLGGLFNNLGAEPTTRMYAAAVDDTNGTPSISWDPEPSDHVEAIAVSGSTVYLGGGFSTVLGQERDYVAAVSTGGDLLDFAPNPDGPVRVLAVSGGTVYVGGSFGSIGGETRSHLAALDASGVPTDWSPEGAGDPYAIAVSSSAVYVGGFHNVDGNNVAYLEAFDRSTGTAESWSPDPDGYMVDAFALSGSSLFVGGDFFNIGGEARTHVAEFNTTTGDLTTWDPELAGPIDLSGDVGFVAALTLKDADTLAVGGVFETVGGVPAPNLAFFGELPAPTTTSTTTSASTTAASTTTAAPATTTATTATTSTTAVVAAPVAPTAPGSVSVGTGTQEVTVVWQPGVVSEPATVTLALAPVVATGVVFQAGTVPVQLTVTSASGAPITSFAQPLEILFPNAPVGFEPASSSDGRTWINLPQLAGTTLPAGFRDGWYRDGAGTVHVLTRHATYFGMVDMESAEGVVEEAEEVVFAYTHPLRLARTRVITVSVRPELPSTAVAVLRRAGRVAAQAKAPAPANATTKLRLRVARAGTYRLTLVVSAGRERFVRVVSIAAK